MRVSGKYSIRAEGRTANAAGTSKHSRAALMPGWIGCSCRSCSPTAASPPCHCSPATRPSCRARPAGDTPPPPPPPRGFLHGCKLAAGTLYRMGTLQKMMHVPLCIGNAESSSMVSGQHDFSHFTRLRGGESRSGWHATRGAGTWGTR